MGKVERRIGVGINTNTPQLEAAHWAAPAFKHGPVATQVPMPHRLLPRLSPTAAAATSAPPRQSCNSVAVRFHSTDMQAASPSPGIADGMSDLVAVKCSARGIACCTHQRERPYTAYMAGERTGHAEPALEAATDRQTVVSSHAQLDKSVAHSAGLCRPSAVKFAAVKPYDTITCSQGVTVLHNGNNFASRCSPRARGGRKQQTLVWRPRHC